MSLGPIAGLGAATSLSDLEETYDKWAVSYEQDMNNIGYPAPETAANICRGLLKDIETARVLDMAAGTGLVGVFLRGAGVKFVDASDMSTEIIKEAQAKGVYDNVFRCVMGEDKVEAEDEVYDAVTIVGCFSIPVNVSAFQELHRVLKPGGHLVATFRPNTWTAADPYGYRAALTDNGQQWRLVEDKLADFHGPLQVDQNGEFHPQWNFVTVQKM